MRTIADLILGLVCFAFMIGLAVFSMIAFTFIVGWLVVVCQYLLGYLP
jgi:hypothetical protein